MFFENYFYLTNIQKTLEQFLNTLKKFSKYFREKILQFSEYYIRCFQKNNNNNLIITRVFKIRVLYKILIQQRCSM